MVYRAKNMVTGVVMNGGYWEREINVYILREKN